MGNWTRPNGRVKISPPKNLSSAVTRLVAVNYDTVTVNGIVPTISVFFTLRLSGVENMMLSSGLDPLLRCPNHPNEVIYTAGLFKGQCDVCVTEWNNERLAFKFYLELKELAQ
jgi:hypothetical protein